MLRLSPLLLSVLLFLALRPTDSVRAQALPPVYVNLVSHNEDNYPYLNNPNTFYAIRPRLLQLAQLCQAKGVKWHLGTDHVLPRAVLAYDVPALQTNTGGMNILRYLTQAYPANVECDPHAHEQVYKYPDVARLLDSVGVDPGHVMSGFLYNQVMNGNDWQRYQTPQPGTVFPTYTWAPDILWGAGTPNHVNDPHIYGMWRPQSMTSFLIHAPANHLISYGQGCRLELQDTSTVSTALAPLRALLAAIQQGTVPANGLYCTSIFFRESALNSPAFLSSKLPELLDSVNRYVSQGRVAWQFIPEVVAEWQTAFGVQPFLVDCDLTVITPLGAKASAPPVAAPLAVAPNPGAGLVTLHFGRPLPPGGATLVVLNALGQTVYSTFIDHSGESTVLLALPALPGGGYTLGVTGSGWRMLTRLVLR